MRCCFLLPLLLLPISLSALEWQDAKQSFKPELADEHLDATFSFTNDADQPLDILKVKTSCGCTLAQLDRTHYEPGESGSLAVRFNFGSRYGLMGKTITVISQVAGAEEQTDQLKLQVDIPYIMRFDRKLQYWQQGETSEAKQSWIIPHNEQDITVTGLDLSEADGFQVELVDDLGEVVQEPSQARAIRVAPISTAQPREGNAYLLVDHPIERHRRHQLYLRVYEEKSAQ